MEGAAGSNPAPHSRNQAAPSRLPGKLDELWKYSPSLSLLDDHPSCDGGAFLTYAVRAPLHPNSDPQLLL